MENNAEKTAPQKNDNKKKGFIIVLALLILSILGNGAQAFLSMRAAQKCDQEVTTCGNEKDQIDSLLADARVLNNKLDGENQELLKVKDEHEAKIAAIEAEVKKLMENVKDEKELARKLRYQLSLIRKLNKDLEDKVDKLLIENKKLADTNTELQDSVSNLSTEKDALSKQVTTASILKSEYITPTAYKRKRSGKFRETKLAKRTNKLGIEFSVLDNAVAKAGEKTVYVRIINPNGEIMGNPIMGSGNFINMASNDTIKFSRSKEFTYSGSKQQLLVEYEEEERIFPKGEYQIEIFIDGFKSSSTTYKLK